MIKSLMVGQWDNWTDDELGTYLSWYVEMWRKGGILEREALACCREYTRRHRTSKGRDRRGNI